MFQQPGLAFDARQGAMPSHGLECLVPGWLMIATTLVSRAATGSTPVMPLPQAGAVELGDGLEGLVCVQRLWSQTATY